MDSRELVQLAKALTGYDNVRVLTVTITVDRRRNQRLRTTQQRRPIQTLPHRRPIIRRRRSSTRIRHTIIRRSCEANSGRGFDSRHLHQSPFIEWPLGG